MEQQPGRRTLVAQLIRDLGHELRKLELNPEVSIHHATLLNNGDSVETRQRVAEVTADQTLLPTEVLSRVLQGVTTHLEEVGLLHLLTPERSIRFIDDLLGLLEAPDADIPRAEQAANVLARTMKVIEPAIAAREPVMRQQVLLDEYQTCILTFVARVQEGMLSIDDAISSISAQTTWLLCSLKVDKLVLEDIPAMDSDILQLLDPQP